MSPAATLLRVKPGTKAVLLTVWLTPKAREDRITGVEQGPDGPVLRAKVRAVPDKGKANMALIELMSDWLGVPKSGISLASGSRSRLKTLEISGDARELEARLTKRLSES